MATPLSAYNFDEPSGPFLDYSGNGRTVTLRDPIQRTATSRNGPGAGTRGAMLAGPGSNVDPAYINTASGSRSMTYWLYATGQPGVWTARCQVSSNDTGGFGVYTTGGNTIARFRRGGSNFNINRPGVPEVGAWHHYAIVYNAATGAGRILLDGVLLGTTTLSGGGPLDNTDWLDVSRDGNTTNDLGTPAYIVDDFRYYDVALTDAEVIADMNTPVAAIVPPDENSKALSVVRGGVRVPLEFTQDGAPMANWYVVRGGVRVPLLEP